MAKTSWGTKRTCPCGNGVRFYDLNKKEYIEGFTTNPTLMRKAGISDYKKFAIELLNHIWN